ncbi:MAG: exosome complex RNA-binding protein Csl4 [Euryarchaeota archaeon]|nr:exosome complex RNA-binding protein Csl4 [Euryarchaeota archaeon]MDE1836090.1 exosome complex RNA-binding protein Csl4 [Euryarchaeota archaeon]MDE1879380.1 exosome complex RNA-binding protein Csl4 [Euryarchaeota archaeon]MDE2044068.1 exosome complex RNA-binding protein Csl4 [Thermoplasmata archaeon]
MSEPSEERLVLPGDLLGTAEEYVPGRGTYEYNGQVYAALMGHPHIDAQNRTVTVHALHEVPHLAEGEVVYARIEEIKSAMLVTTVLTHAKTGRGVPGNPEGTVHISKAKESYVEELSGEFAIGDILKAVVLQGYPVVKLSTQGPELGVILGRCTDCHGILTHASGNQLVCSRCGRREHRKVSRDYGGHKGGSVEEEPSGGRPEGERHHRDRDDRDGPRRHPRREGGHGHRDEGEHAGNPSRDRPAPERGPADLPPE